MNEITFRSDVTVELMDQSATDERVAQAARVSTLGAQSRDEGRPLQGLINFLMRDRHGSPFEHNPMTFFISAPIFVIREFQRHRIGWSYNEESGRYRELEPVFYVPGPDRRLVQVGKPGAYSFEHGTNGQRSIAEMEMQAAYDTTWDSYHAMLDSGIAREVARSVLPLGLYSSMYATCNARSLMHFLSLRTTSENAAVPSFPQREIEMVGERMEELWRGLMPLTHAAFNAHGRVAP